MYPATVWRPYRAWERALAPQPQGGALGWTLDAFQANPLRVSPAYARHAHSLDNRLSIRAGGLPVLRRSNPCPGSGLTGSRLALDPLGPDGDLLGGQGAARLQPGILVAPLL